MTKKLPKDLIPGNASDESVVHASDYTVGFSRGHKEGDISRLQSAAHNFNLNKQYKVDDIVIANNKTYRNTTPNTPGNPFDENEWDLISGGVEELSDLVIDTDKDWQQKIIKNHGIPVDDKDVTTKEYVDSAVATKDTLEELTDTEITNLVKNEALVRNDDNTKWINKKIVDDNVDDEAKISYKKLNISNSIYDNDLISSFRLQDAFPTQKFDFLQSSINNINDFKFNPDGTRLFIFSYIEKKIFQVSLSIPWDVTSITYQNIFFSLPFTSNFEFIDVNPDGTRLFLIQYTDSTIYQYSLTTPWDLTTISQDSVTLSNSSKDQLSRGFVFTPDGNRVYISGRTTRKIYQYSLTTPWDLTASTFVNDISLNDLDLIVTHGISFSPDGAFFFICHDYTKIYQYSLSTPWDITTAYLDFIYYTSINTTTCIFDPNNGQIFTTSPNIDSIQAYSLGNIGVFSRITGLGKQAQDLDMGENKLKNVTTPIDNSDAATKKYVDDTVNVPLLDYDSTKSYKEGESALFSNIQQTTLKFISANTPYNPEDWIPINIHNSKLTTTNTLNYFTQSISVDSISNTGDYLITISNPNGGSLQHLTVGDFIEFDIIINNIPLDIFGKIKTVDNTNNTYEIEIDSQTLGYLQTSSTFNPPLYYDMKLRNYLHTSDIISGYIYNKKDYSDGKPHLIYVTIPANQLLQITPTELSEFTEIKEYLTINKDGTFGLLTTINDDFDQENLLLGVIGRESVSHFLIQSSDDYFIDIIEKITENSQLDVNLEGLVLPYSQANHYEEGQQAIYDQINKITAIRNVSAGKDYDPEDWISELKITQLFPPNRIFYGSGQLTITSKTDNQIIADFTSLLHGEYTLHVGDFVAFPSSSSNYDDSNIGQVTIVQQDVSTGILHATVEFDPNQTLNVEVGNTIYIILLNYLGIFIDTKGVIVNKVDSTDFLPHPNFINLDFHTAPVYISPAEMNTQEYIKDIFISKQNTYELQFQTREKNITWNILQTKLFLATTDRVTQTRFANESNKYWLNFAPQAEVPLNALGNKIPNVGDAVESDDAANLGQVYSISSEQAIQFGVLSDYSESASHHLGKLVSFYGIIQKVINDISENTPYNPLDWMPELSTQQTGTVEDFEIDYWKLEGGFDYWFTANQTDGHIWLTGTNQSNEVTGLEAGKLYYLIGDADGLDGNIAEFIEKDTTAINSFKFLLEKPITLPPDNKRVWAFAYPNRLQLKNPVKGAIVSKKFSDNKYHLTPIKAENPGVTTHTDKFDSGLDGWSVYDVSYAPGSYYGDIILSNSLEHGGSILADFTNKGYSYYYYGGIQKQFTKTSTDSWDKISFEWKTTAIPQGDPNNPETETKLLARIFEGQNVVKEVTLVHEYYLPDSGWRENEIDISDLNQYNSLSITIVLDDYRWLDPKHKVYVDNFKIERIHASNYIEIPNSDLASSSYHKQLVISKDEPTQFSLLEPKTNRDALNEDYVHLANIMRTAVSKWPTKYFPLIKKMNPFENLQQHLETRTLGGENNMTDSIGSVVNYRYFGLVADEKSFSSKWEEEVEREIVLEELYLTMYPNAGHGAVVLATPIKLEVIVNDVIISTISKDSWDLYNQITLKVHKQFIETDKVQIKLTLPSQQSGVTQFVSNTNIQAKIRKMGI